MSTSLRLLLTLGLGLGLFLLGFCAAEEWWKQTIHGSRAEARADVTARVFGWLAILDFCALVFAALAAIWG